MGTDVAQICVLISVSLPLREQVPVSGSRAQVLALGMYLPINLTILICKMG